MTVRTSVLRKMNIHMAKKKARKVVQRSFVKGHSFRNSLYIVWGIEINFNNSIHENLQSQGTLALTPPPLLPTSLVVVAKVFSCLQVLFSSMVQADLGGVLDSHLRPKLLSCCPSIAGGHQKLPNPGS